MSPEAPPSVEELQARLAAALEGLGDNAGNAGSTDAQPNNSRVPEQPVPVASGVKEARERGAAVATGSSEVVPFTPPADKSSDGGGAENRPRFRDVPKDTLTGLVGFAILFPIIIVGGKAAVEIRDAGAWAVSHVRSWFGDDPKDGAGNGRAQAQLNCTNPIAALDLTARAPYMLNISYMTDPADMKKAATDANFVPKPEKTVNTFDPDADPRYRDPALQKIPLPPLPNLQPGQLLPESGGQTVARQPIAALDGHDLPIMACPTTAKKDYYIKPNKKGLTVDLDKIQLTIIPSTADGSGLKQAYEPFTLKPVPGAATPSDITQKEMQRINMLLQPQPGKLNPDIINASTEYVFGVFDNDPAVRDKLLGVIRRGIAAYLSDLTGSDLQVSFTGTPQFPAKAFAASRTGRTDSTASAVPSAAPSTSAPARPAVPSSSSSAPSPEPSSETGDVRFSGLETIVTFKEPS